MLNMTDKEFNEELFLRVKILSLRMFFRSKRKYELSKLEEMKKPKHLQFHGVKPSMLTYFRD